MPHIVWVTGSPVKSNFFRRKLCTIRIVARAPALRHRHHRRSGRGSRRSAVRLCIAARPALRGNRHVAVAPSFFCLPADGCLVLFAAVTPAARIPVCVRCRSPQQARSSSRCCCSHAGSPLPPGSSVNVLNAFSSRWHSASCRDDGRTGLVDHLRPCLPRPPYPHLRADQHQQLQLTPFLCGTRRCSPPLHPLSDLPAGLLSSGRANFCPRYSYTFAFSFAPYFHSPFPAL